jgi:hypothetical protein
MDGIGRLRALEDHAFNYIRDVFTLIHRGLDDFKYFFPLDDLHRVALLVKKLRD